MWDLFRGTVNRFPESSRKVPCKLNPHSLGRRHEVFLELRPTVNELVYWPPTVGDMIPVRRGPNAAPKEKVSL